MLIEIIEADYSNEKHCRDIPLLIDIYASDPMGGGKPLAKEVKNNLVSELAKIAGAFSILAYIDGKAAGLINCFQGFSTFSCKPLINIHDVIVLDEYRGKGLSLSMLQKVEEIAIAKGCCKLTLEVLSNNAVAKSAYKKFGFDDYELHPNAGTALFWQKAL